LSRAAQNYLFLIAPAELYSSMKTFTFAIAAFLALVLTAQCGNRRGVSQIPLVGTEWKLTKLNGASIVGGSIDSYTLMFHDEGKISGVGDCNRFSASFTKGENGGQSVGTLAIGSDLINTRMTCPDMAHETKYLVMLREINSYRIDGEQLMLTKNGNVLAIFERVKEPTVSTQPIDEPQNIQ
jgi:heat shock protein HslJ